MVKVKTEWGPSGEDQLGGDSVDAAARADNKKTDVRMPAGETDWLNMAKNMYEDSTRFLDSSLRAQWERNERAFRNVHRPGSKYFADAYRHRSKLFRPKTRSSIRMGEAQAAAAFFSNEDVVSISAQNENDQAQRISAEINKELLQYRLTAPVSRVGIPWFTTVIGAYQDAQKYGIVISKQMWEYVEREDEVYVPEIDEATGERTYRKEKITRVIADRPRCDLIPPENLRIDRGADWRDPINSSPFVIILHPMYLQDVEERMDRKDRKTGQPQWLRLDRGTLKHAGDRHQWDSTRSFREGSREDSKESEIAIDEYATVWVHENIMRWGGIDWVYFTAGIHGLLSDPVPLTDVYLHAEENERPIVMGMCLIETHKAYPSGKPQLTQDLQSEANELVNLRLDNLKLALSRRWLVQRGRQVDLRSLVRASPGAVTLVNDVDKDVRELETRDVTSSAYKEQDRINVDFDDIAGNFSAGTVQTNRSMNETVGGMQLLAGASDKVSELDLRTFTETWVEPVLSQLVRLEQLHETDEAILVIAAERADIFQRYGVDQITDELLRQNLTVRVNVGMGATDPMQKVAKFRAAAETVGMLLGENVQGRINAKEVIAEVFGALGYRDGSRFFNLEPDPAVQELQEALEELQGQLDKRVVDNETKQRIAEIAAQAALLRQKLDTQGRITEQQIRAASQSELGQRKEYAEDRRQMRDLMMEQRRNDEQQRQPGAGRQST